LRQSTEIERLAALERSSILDAPPDEVLDNITQSVADICGAPIALVTLIGANRLWFKSVVGLSLTDGPIEHSFAIYAIEQPDKLMVVEDVSKDARFADFPLVSGEPHLKFYAGMPLVTPEGYP